MSSEEDKKQTENSCPTCEECTCTGWKVGFWLCFVCCIIVFVVMLILFIKKRKFQEKVLPIIKDRAHKILEKAQNKLNKIDEKSQLYFDNKLDNINKYNDIKTNNQLIQDEILTKQNDAILDQNALDIVKDVGATEDLTSIQELGI